MQSLQLLLAEYHNREPKCQDMRLGQYFMVYYVFYSGYKNPYRQFTWPELFYEEDNDKAAEIINKYLIDHCYISELPKRIDPCNVSAEELSTPNTSLR